MTVREFCRRILESGNLEAKLAPPVGPSGEALPDEPAGPPLCFDRPVRDLKGFARVDLDPGETRTVAIEIAAEDLAYYDTVSGGWVVEPIAHSVEVGRSSRDLPLSGSFTVATP